MKARVIGVAALVAVMLAPAVAVAWDEVPIGKVWYGAFHRSAFEPKYKFRGEAGERVTIVVDGPRVVQVGVKLEKPPNPSEKLSWMADAFVTSGEERPAGGTFIVHAVLPETSTYEVVVGEVNRDQLRQGEERPDGYRILVTKTPARRVRVGFAIGLGPGFVGAVGDTKLALNATLSVGQQRTARLGVDAVLSASVLVAGSPSFVGMLGPGLRLGGDDRPIRLAVGLAATAGTLEALGGGARLDVQPSRRFSLSVEAARFGRTYAVVMALGAAL